MRLFFFLLIALGSSPLQAQRKEYPVLTPEERNFLTKRSADSLIRKGQYYLIYENGPDYRENICNDSLSNIYHFKIRYFNHGCIAINESERIAIKKFNKYMTRALDSVNCRGWINLFTNQQYNCSENFCMPRSAEDTLIAYKFLGNMCLLFDHKSAVIDKRLFCVLDNTIVKVMRKYPDLKVTISGYTASNEGDIHETLAKKRAQNVSLYLQQQGITAKRITTKSTTDTEKYLYDRPVRQFRKVYFEFDTGN